MNGWPRGVVGMSEVEIFEYITQKATKGRGDTQKRK